MGNIVISSAAAHHWLKRKSCTMIAVFFSNSCMAMCWIDRGYYLRDYLLYFYKLSASYNDRVIVNILTVNRVQDGCGVGYNVHKYSINLLTNGGVDPVFLDYFSVTGPLRPLTSIYLWSIIILRMDHIELFIELNSNNNNNQISIVPYASYRGADSLIIIFMASACDV